MEKYADLELEVIEFNTEDIIRTSDALPQVPVSIKPYEIYEADESEEDW